MRNKAKRGTGDTDVLESLVSRLPPSWRVATGSSATPLSLRAPDGSVARLTLVRRSSLSPRDVLALNFAAKGSLAGTVVTAPFLSRRTREMLREVGANYADATGNVRLVVEKPGLFVVTEGAQKDPGREKRPLVSLRGPAAGRVVRALCDVRPPYGVRRLAQIAETPPASVSRVVTLLEREALIERGSAGEIVTVDWEKLLRRWTQDYQVLSSNGSATFLDPRGVKAFLAKVRQAKRPAAVTGSLAANLRAPVAPARVAMVYVEEPTIAARGFQLQPAEAGANVMLLRPFDPVVFTRTWKEKGVAYAALSQVAADLLTSPGRGPSEGEELIAWMKKNPDAWQT
jgi:hypothetical protein